MTCTDIPSSDVKTSSSGYRVNIPFAGTVSGKAGLYVSHDVVRKSDSQTFSVRIARGGMYTADVVFADDADMDGITVKEDMGPALSGNGHRYRIEMSGSDLEQAYLDGRDAPREKSVADLRTRMPDDVSDDEQWQPEPTAW